MRIDWLWVEDFKNLKNVEIDFDESEWVTVVIGWNGTGKSNVLEALATLFGDLIMAVEYPNPKYRNPSFRYKIVYECNGNIIAIDADPGRTKQPYQIYLCSDQVVQQGSMLTFAESVDNFQQITNQIKPISLTPFLKEQKDYLPRNVFAYYSGHSGRMEEIFQPYLEKYDASLRAGDDPGYKRLFYALPTHSQFVLLAFVLQSGKVVDEFLENLLFLDPVDRIESVLFVLNKPGWKSKDGDPRFWHAKGVVQRFLDRLYDVALAPVRIKRKEKVRWNRRTLELLFLYVKDMKSLRGLIGDSEPRDFFRDIESTFVSELINEIRIKIKLKNNDGTVVFRELSEGEQQLLTVLGLLCFTAQDESLFLLDEPDTHLNPRWSADYLEHLQEFVNQSDDNKKKTSHIVFTTHNPLAIAELTKEQVQILNREPDSLNVSARTPMENPRGMGYSNIVTSEMFGLDAAVDKETFELLEKKRLLVGKDELTSQELNALEEVNAQLDGLGFRYETRDPVYTEYLKARYDYEVSKLPEVKPDRMSRRDQKEKAKRLIERALKKTGGEAS